MHGFMAPGRVTPQVKGPVDRKKIGVMPAKSMAQFSIFVRAGDGTLVQHHVLARPFDTVDMKAKKRAICMHHGCAGKEWSDEAELLAKHPKLDEMRALQQVHVWAWWSDAPLGAVDPECAECKKTKGGLPCEKHYGGCIGLIAPAEPKAEG